LSGGQILAVDAITGLKTSNHYCTSIRHDQCFHWSPNRGLYLHPDVEF